MLKKQGGDGWIAISVILCSIILFVALALGLSGETYVRNSRTVRVRFPDVTGIVVSSRVKFAGAAAGTVTKIRILSLSERRESPSNLVEVTLALSASVPPLPKDSRVSIAADTLLSDKFILINAGSPDAPPIGPNDVIQGVAPTTFDQLARDADEAINGLRHMMASGDPSGSKDLVDRVKNLIAAVESTLAGAGPVLSHADGLIKETRAVVADAGSAMAGTKPILADASSVVADARSILSENKSRISRTIDRMDATAATMEKFAQQGEGLLKDNRLIIRQTLSDFRVTADNLKVTSVYARFLLRDLASHPNRLIWCGETKPPVPPESLLLKSAR